MTSGDSTDNAKGLALRRRGEYLGLAAILLLIFILTQDAPWAGSAQLHTLMEALATSIAFIVGFMALVRFRSGRENVFLLIGAGFIGTGLLDAYHTVVTSTFFAAVMPSPPPSLIPWSWSASRTFLAMLLLFSWLIWRRDSRSGVVRPLPELTVYLAVTAVTLISFYFFAFVPLPPAYFQDGFFGRPQELIAALFFAITLSGFFARGRWAYDGFEHWLILSLIVAVALQVPFMARSFGLFDAMFDMAHNLKIVSYLCVYIGLLWSTHDAYEAVEEQVSVLEEKTAQILAAEEQLKLQNTQMNLYFDRAIAGMAITSPDKGWLRVNSAITELFGYDEEELKALTWAELTHPDDLDEDVALFDRLVAGQIDGYQLEKRFLRKDGAEVTCLLAVSIMRKESGEPDFVIAQIVDLTDLKAQEVETVRARDKLEAIASATNAGILAIDGTGSVDYLSPRFTQLFGYGLDDLRDGRRWANQAGIDEFSQKVLGRIFAPEEERALLGSARLTNLEVQLLARDGKRRAALLSVLSTGENSVATFSDISEQKRRQETMQYLSQHDALTGLPNRSLLSERLEWQVRQARRSLWQLCVGFLDLDGFKAVNDTHGHHAGDLVLKETAIRLQKTIREVDMVARLGGDEFAIIFSEIQSRQECVPLFERILQVVSQPISIRETTLSVSASLGLAFYAQDQVVDGDQLLRQADKAMYDAKIAGKNRFNIFDPDLDQSLRESQAEVREIMAAMDTDQFTLYYQPVVNMRSGEVVQAEALLRWIAPTGQVALPDSFLPTVYSHKISEQLGSWVMERALQDLEKLLLTGRSIALSINVFPRQFVAEDFITDLQRRLDIHEQVRPELIQLELVETAALNDIEGAKRAILACQELGIKCALDDFGTGYSSLSHLRHLPVSTLKIDRSFVAHMLSDPNDLAIVEATLSLAGAFDRKVLAEGVETLEQGQRLLDLGCELAQGYVIAEPMPLDQLLPWLDRWEAPPMWTHHQS